MQKYQHYKNKKYYELIDFALHSETYDEMVIYKAMYESEKFGLNRIWVRPKTIFFENVEHDGEWVPRFKLINE
jgi:hypothetical protein